MQPLPMDVGLLTFVLVLTGAGVASCNWSRWGRNRYQCIGRLAIGAGCFGAALVLLVDPNHGAYDFCPLLLTLAGSTMSELGGFQQPGK
jgi:hypothetical protein